MDKWMYNEFKHCGVDYSKEKQAEAYDDQHQKFRDYEKEFKGMMDFLQIQDAHSKTVVDLGCGTGAISVFVADLFKVVYAVDISDVMLEKAKRKINKDVPNLKFVNAGFLSYQHEDEPVDLVITKVAFHHLPDFWKQIALLRINRILKMNGLLYIHDVVFQFAPQDYVTKINAWISVFEKAAGAEFKSEVETHIRDEYSTFGWILKGMLDKAGFVVEKCESRDDFVSEYVCRKAKELNIG